MEDIGKGVCRLSIVPIRSKADHESVQVSQLLFGDHYQVLAEEKNKKWLLIKVHFDGIEGWIDTKQHYAIDDAYFDQISYSNYKICTDVCANILFKKNAISILIGSILPISTSELFAIEENLAFNGEAKSLGQKRDVDFLLSVARKYLYSPYLLGGKTPFGIDDSGLIQQIFKINGYSLKRTSKEQKLQGDNIKLDNIEGGDLVFYTNNEQKESIGLAFSSSTLMIVDGHVKIVKKDSNNIIDDLNQTKGEITLVKRIIKQK